MKNLREVKEDLLKEWPEFREEAVICVVNAKDKKHKIQFEEICNRILKNVPNQNNQYVKAQLELLDRNYMDYIDYWNEKYYRNGFVDGIELLKGIAIN